MVCCQIRSFYVLFVVLLVTTTEANAPLLPDYIYITVRVPNQQPISVPIPAPVAEPPIPPIIPPSKPPIAARMIAPVLIFAHRCLSIPVTSLSSESRSHVHNRSSHITMGYFNHIFLPHLVIQRSNVTQVP